MLRALTKNSLWRSCLLWMLAGCLNWALIPTVAFADYPYATNYRIQNHDLIWSQAAFAPERVIGRNIFMPDPKNPERKVISPLQQPRDMFIDGRDQIYVADTGSNRIVKFSPTGVFDRIITVNESPLSNPQGLFVDALDSIYVADTGNKRVVKIDQQGAILKQYKLPESRVIPANYRFEPIKVAVDKRGYLYIVSLGSYNGLLQLDPDGGFTRFFAANKTPITLLDAFKRKLYTREMYDKQPSKLPPAINNVAIDGQGFVYTVSYGPQMSSQQVKKLNNAGNNLLGTSGTLGTGNKSFGEFRFPAANTIPSLADIAVDGIGNFSVVDSQLKLVSQYDAKGNLLFFWSGDASTNTTQLGIVQSPSAIGVNSRNELLILDDQAGLIQMFRETEFGALVYQANALTLDGLYRDAEPLWREVLHLNAYYTPAVLGLAQSAYQRGDYGEARRLFFQAGAQKGYSNAFWQIRLQWFQHWFGFIINLILGVGIVYFLSSKIAKRFGLRIPFLSRIRVKSRLLDQIRHGLYILKHPVDGFTALRYENKGSLLSTFLILVIAFLSYFVTRSYTSFSFNAEAARNVSIMPVLLQFFIVWIGWVVSNHLVSSIMRGEGRFKDVFMGSAYALTPFVVVGLPLTLLSNGMTQSETSIYHFLHNGMMIWILLLMVWQVLSIQNYTIGETMLNIFLTACTMIVTAVLCFILFGLFAELRDFVYSIYQEVTVR